MKYRFVSPKGESLGHITNEAMDEQYPFYLQTNCDIYLSRKQVLELIDILTLLVEDGPQQIELPKSRWERYA